MIAHLLWWGDTYHPEPAGPPRLFLHRDCGGPIRTHFTCGDCGTVLNAADIATAPGPGARAGRRSAVKVRPGI